jgi:hypothetical protein
MCCKVSYYICVDSVIHQPHRLPEVLRSRPPWEFREVKRCEFVEVSWVYFKSCTVYVTSGFEEASSNLLILYHWRFSEDQGLFVQRFTKENDELILTTN